MTTPSPEQQAILNVAKTTNDGMLVEALAGTGKTWTLIECIKVLPQASTIVLAFNTRIADEMTKRLPKIPRGRLVHVKTLHSAGFWIARQHFPNIKLDKNESERLIDRSCVKGTSLRVRGAALRLLRVVKDFQYEPVLDADLAYNLGTDYGSFDKLQGGADIQNAVEITQRAYELSVSPEREKIDFCDMTWLPLVLGLQPPSRYKAVLIDEVQDVSPNQFAMVDLLLASGGRVIACGDQNQAIYGWRGATPAETWEILKDRYKTRPLPLTTTWRCDQAIVKQANEIVPSLRARPNAGPGEVNSCDKEGLYEAMPDTEGTVFVLSRTNASLLKVALEMWKRGISFNISQSPEVVWPLKDIVKKIERNPDVERAMSPNMKMAAFKQALGAWNITENMKANQAGSSTWAERVEEQFQMLTHCMGYVDRPDAIPDLLDTIFTEDPDNEVLLSTVHKAKGLEANHVFLLRDTFSRYQKRKNEKGEMVLPRISEIDPEELNIEYVAITRARHVLTWVHLDL
jgi:DNA helicase-2/ATP-dependent DNA helicase PcrA